MSKRPGDSLNGVNGKVQRLDAGNQGIVKKQGRCKVYLLLRRELAAIRAQECL
jgi:hypothetical protein